MLSETLEIFQNLPVASLFQSEQLNYAADSRNASGVESSEETALLEIADKCASFSDSALSGHFGGSDEGTLIPLEDQYLVLALRLELSLQFGNLSEVLKSISLLLDLWGAECEPHECEESEAGVVHAGSETAPILPAKSLKAAPIVQQLMRVAAINKNHQLPQNDEEPQLLSEERSSVSDCEKFNDLLKRSRNTAPNAAKCAGVFERQSEAENKLSDVIKRVDCLLDVSVADILEHRTNGVATGPQASATFTSILADWRWKDKFNEEDISNCLDVVFSEQKSILSKAHNTKFINALNHLAQSIQNYYKVYLEKELTCSPSEPRTQQPSSIQRAVKPNISSQTRHETESSSLLSLLDGETNKNFFGKALGKAALSFAFNFLKKCWRSASVEDRLMCSEMLSETLEIFQNLPVASLFQSEQLNYAADSRNASGVESSEETALLEIADKCASFLDSALSG